MLCHPLLLAQREFSQQKEKLLNFLSEGLLDFKDGINPRPGILDGENQPFLALGHSIDGWLVREWIFEDECSK